MSDKEKLAELKKYLYENKIKGAHFAKSLGIDSSSFCRYFRGARKPSTQVKKLIEFLTKGKIKFDEDS